jgi:hypothetical protein
MSIGIDFAYFGIDFGIDFAYFWIDLEKGDRF